MSGRSVVEPDLLRANFDELLPHDYGSAVLRGADGKPCAIIVLVNDPEIATKLAAMLPQIESRLGIVPR